MADSLNSDDEDVAIERGKTYIEMGDKREAIRHFEDAIQRKASAVEAHIYLGMLYVCFVQHETAYEHMKIGALSNPALSDTLSEGLEPPTTQQ
jgi:Tfp pilus assembly protein PilF